jgi:lysyl-tRNA synthetase class 2
LKDAEGGFKSMLREMIFLTKRKQCTMLFSKLLDIGDFIGVRGTVFRTQVGEISVHIYGLTVWQKP